MSLLDRVRTCARWDRGGYRPFKVEGRIHGQIRKELAEHLVSAFGEVFKLGEHGAVLLAPGLNTPELRSEKVAGVVRQLCGQKDSKGQPWIAALSGVQVPLVRYWGQTPVLALDRAALPAVGGRSFGLSINIVDQKPSGTSLWIARRDATTERGAGKLDAAVDWPLEPGDTLRTALAKAADQGAGIALKSLGDSGKPASLVSYIYALPDGGLCNEAWFCFDYGPVRNFTPRDKTGKIAAFTAMPVDDVVETLRETQDFSDGGALVTIDHLIRNGVVHAGSQPDFQQIIQGLRLGHEEEMDYWHNGGLRPPADKALGKAEDKGPALMPPAPPMPPRPQS